MLSNEYKNQNVEDENIDIVAKQWVELMIATIEWKNKQKFKINKYEKLSN